MTLEELRMCLTSSLLRLQSLVRPYERRIVELEIAEINQTINDMIIGIE